MGARIGIIDIGVANVYSVESALAFLGYTTHRVTDATEMGNTQALVLPGVGAFGTAMTRLRERGLDAAIRTYANSGLPVLGICLGMQLLVDHSCEFGEHEGLGLIPGRVEPLPADPEHPVPHAGWANVSVHLRIPALQNITDENTFAFDHSYEVRCDGAFVAATARRNRPVAAVIAKDNVVGVQFHPEKSQRSGLVLLRNFFAGAGVAGQAVVYG